MDFPPFERYRHYVDRRRADGLLRRVEATGPAEPGRAVVAGRRRLNFSSNDYLGLSRDPRLAARAASYAEIWGTGAGASPLITGESDAHVAVEKKLAVLKGVERVLLYPAGYQANVAVLTALLDRQVLGAEPIVFSDRLVHASLHAGCRAAGARQQRFAHNDLARLGEMLRAVEGDRRPKFILSESIFSMDGDRADIGGLTDLAVRHRALLVIDEAHATGVAGTNGMGLTAGCDAPNLVATGTFSKALGAQGGYVAAAAPIVEYLVQASQGYVYSTALSPMVLGAVDAALDLVPGMDAGRRRLDRMAGTLRGACRALGLDVGQSDGPIVPVIVGADGAALRLGRGLLDEDILGLAIRPPTVPKGRARVRLTVTLSHTDSDLETLVDALRRQVPRAMAA